MFPPAFLGHFRSLLETRYALAKCFTITRQGPFLSRRLEMYYRCSSNFNWKRLFSPRITMH